MKWLLLPVVAVVPLACQQADTTIESTPVGLAGLAPLPRDPPQLAENPITEGKVELGKMLFFEPRLSRSWLISCNTCHNLALGGVDLLATSVGHGWQQGPRNSPTVLNAVFNVAQFWDGRAEDLKEQAMGPVQAAVEMSNTPERVVQTLQSIPEYVDQFAQAFPGEENPVTFENMARAIEAFEATLLTPGSRFDRYLDGDGEALDQAELEGLELFTGKGCTACHGGSNVGGAGYFPFGLVQKPGADLLPPDDKGRSAVTQVEAEDYFFKAPSLRNVELTPPYFHSGAVWDLDAAVRVMGTAQLGTELTDADAASLAAFLRTLTGNQPQIEYPILPRHTKDTPLPDLGPIPGEN
jgi:cytochrome c peroxidase